MNGIILKLLQIGRSPDKRCSTACRQIFYCLTLLVFFATGAFSQNDGPIALQSAARALTVGELSGEAERAESGNVDSQILLGLSLRLIAEHINYDKEGQAGMYRSSIYWLRKAANKGSAPAEYFLAETDVEQVSTWDPKLSLCEEVSPLLNEAISQNYAPAMTALGRRYMEGWCGVKVNDTLGLQWLKKAFAAGDPEAAYRIGDAYNGGGRGDQRDLREANRWFLKGAEMGDASSQYALGVNLAAGIGTRKNVTEAAEWFRKSAEHGDEFGMCNLALDYMRGEGIAKDIVLSLKWVLISDRVNDGGNLCGDEIDIRPFLKLTPPQEAEATRQANAWLKQHNYPLTELPKSKCRGCNPLTGNVNLVR